MTDSREPMAEPAARDQDEAFMRMALQAAQEAEVKGDLPVGAVLVHEGRVIARAGNARRVHCDPTAHAELRVLREGARVLGDWRLQGCTLYATLEPCAMCAGAIVLARLDRVVYAAADPKGGAVRSLYRLVEDPRLNHRADVTPGVLGAEAGAMLTAFFRDLREKRARERRGDREAEGA